MPTEEIPRDEWVAFFDSFSHRHEGWLVTIEVFGADLGDQIQARDLPLEGITAELDDDGGGEILILAGRKPDSHISHTVSAPARVWLKQTRQRADEVLDIESEDMRVLIRFRSALPPEMVDGIVKG
ncbi:MAG: DUF5335 domain-containing protein [Blastocatellia bacterium]|nr:DUF5335 domain-containing protein [Blastocatellia bacterium]